MLLVMSGVAGLLVGWARGGRVGNLGQLNLRFAWIVAIAAMVQIGIVFQALRASNPGLAGALLIGSYLAVLLVCWLNRAYRGLWLVGLGVLLNLLVVLPQGGLMPVTPEALHLAGRPAPSEVGGRLIISKDVVLPREVTPLWAISDRFVVPSGVPMAGVFSPGDVIIAGGLAIFLAGAMDSAAAEERRATVAISTG